MGSPGIMGTMGHPAPAGATRGGRAPRLTHAHTTQLHTEERQGTGWRWLRSWCGAGSTHMGRQWPVRSAPPLHLHAPAFSVTLRKTSSSVVALMP